MKYLLIFLSFTLSFIWLSAFGQTRIGGTVISKADKKPVSNASVYFNNSSIGTTSDDKGNFSLTVYTTVSELVISHLGYEKQTILIDSKTVSDNLVILLKTKTDLLDNVVIETKNKETWKKWGQLFTDYFIGELEFSKKCKILNPEVVRFSYNKATQTLTAKARKPILIQNKALGYTFQFDLDSFSYSFQTNHIFRAGTSFFEMTPAKDSAERIEQTLNRLFAYKGSKMHFMRSLYENNYKNQGFEIYVFKARKNVEKERIQKLLNAREAHYYEHGVGSGPLQVNEITNNKDSLIYYVDVMASPGYVFHDSTKINGEERLSDMLDGVRLMQFSGDTLLVQFNKAIESGIFDPVRRAKHYKQLSSDLKKSYDFFRDYSPSQKQFTILYLLQGDFITIEKNGSYHEFHYLFEDGYMAWKKMAYLLPWDYDPKKDEQIVNN